MDWIRRTVDTVVDFFLPKPVYIPSPPVYIPSPPVYIPSPPRTEYIRDDSKVRELEAKLRELQRNEERLERIRQDEVAERKAIREADERMKRTVMEKTNEDQRIHDEQMAKAQTEFNNQLKKLNEENQKDRGQSAAEHKIAMLKLETEFKAQREQLDADLERSKKENNEKIRNMENGCEELKTKRLEEIDTQRKEIRNTEQKYRQEIREIKNKQDQLRNEMFEERRAHQKLELDKQVETCEKLADDLDQRYIEEATIGMLKKYVNVMESARQTGERLQEIQHLCDGRITADSLSDAKFYIKEVSLAKNDFQCRVKQLRGYVMNDKRCHREVVQICNNYVRQYEQVVNGSILTELRTQLPNAIKAKDVNKVKGFGRQAEDINIQIENIQNEVLEKLREVKDDQSMGQIEG